MSTLKVNILDTPSGSGNITLNRPMDGSGTFAAANLTGTLPAISGANLTNLPAGVSTGFIGGLTITNNGSDGDHDIDIAVGSARDYTDAVIMTQGTAALTKRIDATWAVGDGNGGLDSTDTVANNTGYGVYLIRRSGTGVVDVLISTDMTAAGSALTMPTSYDQKRLIGWVRTDGSANILSFTQRGDFFRITEGFVADLADATITGETFETATLTVPPLTNAIIYGSLVNTASTNTTGRLAIKTKGSDEAATDVTELWAQFGGGGMTFDRIGRYGTVFVDLASQVEYAAEENDGTATVTIKVVGCELLTRSNP